MKKRLKFIWGTNNVIPGKWRLGLYCSYARGGAINTRGLAVNLYGVIVWGIVALIAGYLGVATALHQWMKSRPHNLVTWTDCALYPLRSHAIRAKRGMASIKDGFDDLKAGNVMTGIRKLAVGIDRYPNELKGRLTLASYYDLANARARAIDTLVGGFPHAGTDREFLEAVAKVAAEGENYELWLEACDVALKNSAGVPAAADLQRWARLQKITALIQSDRADEAARLADDWGAATDVDYAELKAHALLRSGTPLDAILFIESAYKNLGHHPALVGMLARSYREAGRRTEMEKTFEELRSLRPTDPQVYIAIIVNRALIGDTAGATEALNAFLTRFNAATSPANETATASLGRTPTKSEPLEKLAESLVLTGRSALARLVLEDAARQGHALLRIQQFLVETHITAKEWTEARAVLRSLPTADAVKDPAFTLWLLLRTQLIDAIIDPAEGVQATLVNSVRGRQLTLASYRRTVASLQEAGRVETARTISQFALGIYPRSPWLQSTAAQLARAVRTAELAKSVALPTPAPVDPDAAAAATAAENALRAAQDSVADETAFMDRLVTQIRSGHLPEVISALRDVRKFRPAWLTARETEIALLELRTYGLLDETVNLQRLTRLYLAPGAIRYQAVIDLATELHAAGHAESAIALLQEIKRRTPNNRPVLQLLEKWATPISAPRS